MSVMEAVGLEFVQTRQAQYEKNGARLRLRRFLAQHPRAVDGLCGMDVQQEYEHLKAEFEAGKKKWNQARTRLKKVTQYANRTNGARSAYPLRAQ